MRLPADLLVITYGNRTSFSKVSFHEFISKLFSVLCLATNEYNIVLCVLTFCGELTISELEMISEVTNTLVHTLDIPMQSSYLPQSLQMRISVLQVIGNHTLKLRNYVKYNHPSNKKDLSQLHNSVNNLNFHCRFVCSALNFTFDAAGT